MYSVDGHWAIFNVWMLQIMLQTFLYMSFGIYMYVWMLHIYLRMESLGHREYVCSALADTAKHFPKWCCSAVVPAVDENPVCPHPRWHSYGHNF